jgi:hypothetical protein
MSAITWWLPPIVATLVAVGWVVLTSRPRRPADVHETLEHFERFKTAIERDTLTRHRRRRWRRTA